MPGNRNATANKKSFSAQHKSTMSHFKKTRPSGNYYANSVVTAMFGDGWIVLVLESSVVYPKNTQIFVTASLSFYFSGLNNNIALYNNEE